jgi:hypothetical protein
MPPTMGDLAGSAQTLLDLFVAQLTALEVDLPEDDAGNVIAYISTGPEAGGAWDQAGIQCFVNEIYQGSPGLPDQRPVGTYQLVWSATFAVVLLRDVSGLSDSGIPGADEITADAQLTIGDMAAMTVAATQIRTQGLFCEPGEPAVLGPAIPLAPAGFIGGTMFTFSVRLQ